MTERSILQHQRCQAPFVKANNQVESEVGGLDDARNHHSRPPLLSTSFSHFLCLWRGSEVTEVFVRVDKNLPGDVLVQHLSEKENCFLREENEVKGGGFSVIHLTNHPHNHL